MLPQIWKNGLVPDSSHTSKLKAKGNLCCCGRNCRDFTLRPERVLECCVMSSNCVPSQWGGCSSPYTTPSKKKCTSSWQILFVGLGKQGVVARLLVLFCLEFLWLILGCCDWESIVSFPAYKQSENGVSRPGQVAFAALGFLPHLHLCIMMYPGMSGLSS